MTSAAFIGRRVAILFGDDEYQDRRLENLSCVRRDISAMAAVLGDPSRGGFDTTVMPVGVTWEALQQVLSQELGGLTGLDTILIYYSGHAIRGTGGQLLLALAQTDLGRPRTALSLKGVVELIERSSAGRSLLILDCCFAGAIEQNFRELQQERDTWIIAAATADQSAFLKEGSEHSILTGFLLDGLEAGHADVDDNGEVSVYEAFVYAERLASAAFRNAIARQQPVLFVPTGARGSLTLSLNPLRRSLRIDDVDLAALQAFVTMTGVSRMIREPGPFQFFIQLMKGPEYEIEGEKCRAFSLAVSSEHTPNMMVYQDRVECDAIYPPSMLSAHALEGKQVIDGRVRVRLGVALSSISSVIGARVDVEAEDSAKGLPALELMGSR
jgi:Caspase domain